MNKIMYFMLFILHVLLGMTHGSKGIIDIVKHIGGLFKIHHLDKIVSMLHFLIGVVYLIGFF